MPPVDAAEEAAIAERVYLARVRQCFVHAAGNSLSAMVGGGVQGIVLYQSGADPTIIVGWFFLLALFSFGPVWVERAFHRATLTQETAPLWVRRRLTAGATVAFILAVSAFMTPVGEVIPLLVLFIILTTLVAVSGVGYSTIPRYVYLVAAVTTGPLILRFLLTPDPFHLTMALACAAWLYVYLGKAALVSRTAIGNIEANERLQVEVDLRIRAEGEIRFLAHHDPLTGAANRRYFEEVFDQALARARRGGGKVALVMIDLDRFKPINDTHGHIVGDELLKQVTDRLQKGIRQTDTLARIGGDEFAVVMEAMEERDDLAVALEKIMKIFADPFVIDGVTLPLGASLGGALYPDDGDSLDGLSHAADVKMYAEKRRRSEEQVVEG